MPLQKTYRKLGQVAFVNGGVSSFDLPRALLYHYLSLRLSGTVDIVTAAPTAFPDAPWSLIRRVELVADGKDTLKSVDFEHLAVFNRIFYGTAPAGSSMPVGVSNNQPFNAHAVLPFEMPRSVRPIDTLLKSKNLSTLQLVVTWGTRDNVYSSNSGNVTINPVTKLDIASLESFGVEADFAAFKQLSLIKDVTSAQTEFQIQLPVGNMFRGFLLKAVNYGAGGLANEPGTPTNSVINRITLRSGTTVFFSKEGPETQDDNKRAFGLETWPTGYYVIDFSTDGLLTESLDARALSNLDLILDVSNPPTSNKIKVYPLEWIPPISTDQGAA